VNTRYLQQGQEQKGVKEVIRTFLMHTTKPNVLVFGRFFLALGVDVDSDVDAVVGAGTGAGVAAAAAEEVELSGVGCECHEA
jgi:hypothetical protein